MFPPLPLLVPLTTAALVAVVAVFAVEATKGVDEMLWDALNLEWQPLLHLSPCCCAANARSIKPANMVRVYIRPLKYIVA